jgi:hypothetical protein
MRCQEVLLSRLDIACIYAVSSGLGAYTRISYQTTLGVHGEDVSFNGVDRCMAGVIAGAVPGVKVVHNELALYGG